MLLIFALVFLGCYFVFVPFRLVVQHPIAAVRYACTDTYSFFKLKKINCCKTGEIVAYVGLFGRGKTLSAVHKVCTLYRRYNDAIVWDRDRSDFVIQKIKIISNVHLTQVPYERFVSLEQIVLAAENNKESDFKNGTLTVTLVLGDEFSVQLNSRSFKSNINPLFLNTILTCRHHHISLYYTAQRFNHVDALLRQVTSYVVDCNKIWRFQLQNAFDAWELENASSTLLLSPISRGGFFVYDYDYASYDTLACVENLKKSFDEGDMMNSDEILALQCNAPANMEAVARPSRKYKRAHKTRK